MSTSLPPPGSYDIVFGSTFHEAVAKETDENRNDCSAGEESPQPGTSNEAKKPPRNCLLFFDSKTGTVRLELVDDPASSSQNTTSESEPPSHTTSQNTSPFAQNEEPPFFSPGSVPQPVCEEVIEGSPYWMQPESSSSEATAVECEEREGGDREDHATNALSALGLDLSDEEAED